MSDYCIQPAALGEAPILSDLALRSKAYWGYDQHFIDNCKVELSYTAEQLNSKEWCFQVAKDLKQKIIGFYALQFISKQKAELEALFVEPGFIGQGVGKLLLRQAIEQAKSRKLTKLIIHSDPFAEAFYLTNGATKIGETKSASIPGRFLPLLCIKF